MKTAQKRENPTSVASVFASAVDVSSRAQSSSKTLTDLRAPEQSTAKAVTPNPLTVTQYSDNLASNLGSVSQIGTFISNQEPTRQKQNFNNQFLKKAKKEHLDLKEFTAKPHLVGSLKMSTSSVLPQAANAVGQGPINVKQP